MPTVYVILSRRRERFVLVLFAAMTTLSFWFTQVKPAVSEAAATSKPCEVAVAASNFSGRWALYLLRPYLGLVYELSPHAVADRRPVWSPDGRQLAFERRDAHNWDIYTLDVATGVVRRLTSDPAFDGHPSWSPDGTMIAFESSRSGVLSIYRVAATGGEQTLLFSGEIASTAPSWRQGKQAIVFSSWDKGRRGLYSALPGANAPIPVGVFEDLGQGAAGRSDYATAVQVADESHVIIRHPDGIQRDVTGSGQHDEWPTWDRSTERWVALRLVGGNRYEYPVGWRLVVFGQPTVEAPLFLPGQWQRLGCAPHPSLYLKPLPATYQTVSSKDLIAQGQGTPVSQVETLTHMPNVKAIQPQFVQSVAPSFNSLRAEILEESGYDILARLNDAWRDITSDSGATFSWHRAGRAFDMIFAAEDAKGKPLLFLSKEELRGEIYFRIYIRTLRQDGSQGEPLRQSLWVIDFDQRDEAGLPAGGRSFAPSNGYFVDFTDLAQRYGWMRISAVAQPDYDWREDFYAMEYWHYERRDGLCWYTAMQRLYSEDRMLKWLHTARLQSRIQSLTLKDIEYLCIPTPPSIIIFNSRSQPW